MKKSVLITGASSGIGKEIAILLAENNFRVFAGVRKKSDKFNLEKINKNIIGVYLDVTSESSIEKAFWYVIKKTSSLCAIINNAGIAIGGPIEYIPVKKIKEQFDVNTLGPIRLTQKFLPLLTDGRIINVSSMASTGIFPFVAPYCASKRAMDILMNAFELELCNNEIKVISIKPGTIKTPIWNKSLKNNFEYLKDLPEGQVDKYRKELNLIEKNAITNSESGESPINVAKVVLKALTSKNPRASYTVGKDAFWVVLFAKMPQGFVNFIVKKFLKKRIIC